MNEKTKNLVFKTVLVLFYVGAILLCVPAIQDFVLSFGAKLLLHRELNYPNVWVRRMTTLSLIIALFSVLLTLKIEKLPILFLCAIAFMASLYFTSFSFSTRTSGTDQSVFIYIGQMMHRGFLPYRDMFDHKGLYLYFFEFLGTSKTGYSAIYLLDFVSLLVSAIFIYKICLLQSSAIKQSVLSTFFILCIGAVLVYEGGNLTESYALPCISYSLFIFLKYLKTQECSNLEIIFAGITFTIVLFLRVNMVAMWVFFVLLIIALLLRQKQFAALGRMVLFFTAGVLIALLPVAIYLFTTGTAKHLWESYILFNLKYITNSSGGKVSAAKYFVKILIIPNIVFATSLAKNYKNKLLLIDAAAFLFAFYFVVISGYSYGHYGMVLLPYFALPTAALFPKNVAFSVPNIPKRLLGALIAIFLVVFCFSIANLGRFSSHKAGDGDDIVSYLKTHTETTDDVLVLGNDVHYNIESNRFTKQRFFYQSPICFINPEFFAEFQEQILSESPDYIVCPAEREEFLQKEQVRSLLDKIAPRYDKISLSDGYILKKK